MTASRIVRNGSQINRKFLRKKDAKRTLAQIMLNGFYIFTKKNNQGRVELPSALILNDFQSLLWTDLGMIGPIVG